MIRHANLSDLDQLAKIENTCFNPQEAASYETIKARLQVYPDFFWLYEKDDTIISFINGFCTNDMDLKDIMYENPNLHDKLGKWQMIFGVNTYPAYQHHGYASATMKQAIKDAKNQHRLGLVLTCKEHMISFYEQFGFKNEGVSSSTHGDVLWYQMRLTF